MKEQEKLKVFFFANLPVKGIDASYGGATVLAEEILKFLESDPRLSIKHSPIRFSWRPKLHLIDHFLWIFRFPFVIRKYDVVSFHTTWDFTFSSAPMLWMIAKMMRKRTIYHFFGGNFALDYQRLPGFLKYLYRHTILKSDVVFFETKAMIEFFNSRQIVDAQWLPNARKPAEIQFEKKEFSKKFVFISRIIPEKGVNEIIEAAEKLTDDYTVDLYGPIDLRYFSEDLFKNKRVKYKGVLKPDEVIRTLVGYDVLLLPSWFAGEGYPGIIIEALSIGIPAITTKWRSVPEIIDDNNNGKLIDIKSPEQLYQAIISFNKENYQSFSQNALKSFEHFDSNHVFKKIVNSYFK